MCRVCYLRRGSDVFETYWTTRRGFEAMDNSYRLVSLTIYGRQEEQEISAPGWPQNWGENETVHPFRSDGRPIAQWQRLAAGFRTTLATEHLRRGGAIRQRTTPFLRQGPLPEASSTANARIRSRTARTA